MLTRPSAEACWSQHHFQGLSANTAGGVPLNVLGTERLALMFGALATFDPALSAGKPRIAGPIITNTG